VALTPENVLQMAVGHLGQTEIVSSITSPTTKAEKLGALWFDRTRNRINAKHNWSWATRRATLTDVTSTESREGWTFAYTLPADFLRFVAIDLGYRSGPPPAGLDPANPTLPGARWAIEMNTAGTGKILLCDIEGAVGVYVAKVTTLDLWDEDAIEALTLALTEKLAMPLTSKADWAQLAKAAAKDVLDKAIADDADEANPDPQTTSEIITSRIY
jgi:hypothetical protein